MRSVPGFKALRSAASFVVDKGLNGAARALEKTPYLNSPHERAASHVRRLVIRNSFRALTAVPLAPFKLAKSVRRFVGNTARIQALLTSNHVVRDTAIQIGRFFVGTAKINIKSLRKTLGLVKALVPSPANGHDTLAESHSKIANAASKAGQAIRTTKFATKTIMGVIRFLAALLGWPAVIGLVFLYILSYLIANTICPSNWDDASKVYKYITLKDAIFTTSAYSAASGEESAELYFNGEAVKDYTALANFQTDADLFLAYLYAKMGDVRMLESKPEIDRVFDELYIISVSENQSGRKRISLTVKDFSAWLYSDIESKLGSGGAETLIKIMADGGPYQLAESLNNPFGKNNWAITSRFGYKPSIKGDFISIFEEEAMIIESAPGKVYAPIDGIISLMPGGVLISGDGFDMIIEGIAAMAVNEGDRVSVGSRIGACNGTLSIKCAPSQKGAVIALERRDYVNPAFFIGGRQSQAYGTNSAAFVSTALKEAGNSGEKYCKWYWGTPNGEWCAMFISWCADRHGLIEAGVIPRYSTTTEFTSWFKARGGYYLKGERAPQPGDIIFFDFNHNGSSDHVGIVVKASNSYVYTIEGNATGARVVKNKKYSLYSPSILGYGAPKWPTSPDK